MTAVQFLELFAIGVATPLTAACVIPLYPAFLGYLASTGEGNGPSAPALGLLVVGGVVSFMALVGLVFSAFLETSLTVVVSRVSPVAFLVLGLVGLVLLVSPGGFSRLPAVEPPHSQYPSLSAFGYGFFFGAIIIPCNPGLIALFFARSSVLFDTYVESMVGFLAFALGIGAPLLAFAVVSESHGRRITRTLAGHSTLINRGVGVVLLAVAAYYLFVVFETLPLPS